MILGSSQVLPAVFRGLQGSMTGFQRHFCRSQGGSSEPQSYFEGSPGVPKASNGLRGISRRVMDV